MERQPGSGESERRRSVTCAAAVLIALSLTACTVAVSPTPSTMVTPKASTATSLAPTPSEMNSVPTASPAALSTPESLLTDTPQPTNPPQQGPTESPTPPLPRGPLPSLAAAPAGAWTGLKWIAIPGGHSPKLPEADPNGDSNATLRAWSRGYIEFVWDPFGRRLVPYVSADGLSWHTGNAMDTSAWAPDLKKWDSNSAEIDSTITNDPTNCTFEVGQFQQGGSDLLLTGSLTCWTAGCGSSPFVTREAMWASPDALAWTPIDIPTAFPGGQYGRFSGGPNGFVTLGTNGTEAKMLTSPDGLTWSSGSMPAAALTAGSYVSDPVSFGGGYVLPGVLLEKKGHQAPGWATGGCAGVGQGPTDLSLYQAALWWSSDGVNWTRDGLGGTTSSYSPIVMDVSVIDDHTVVATETINGVDLEWASTDGRAWTPLQNDPIPVIDLVFGHDRSLFCLPPSDGSGQACSTIAVLGSNYKLVPLSQSGSAPFIDSWQMALGPTGLLVTGDGSRFWIGVPTA